MFSGAAGRRLLLSEAPGGTDFSGNNIVDNSALLRPSLGVQDETNPGAANASEHPNKPHDGKSRLRGR